MATVVVNDVEHVYAPNPKMETELWGSEFPPIVSDSKWLRNKYTGEIVPNFKEFAERSDIYEVYADTPQGAPLPEFANIGTPADRTPAKQPKAAKASTEEMAEL